MKGKQQRRMQVEELTFSGYNQFQISEKLNVSVSTIQRDLNKLRNSNQGWLDELAQKGLIHAYREGLEGYRNDMTKLRDMLESEDVKKDMSLQVRIYKTIGDLRKQHLDLLGKHPIIWSFQVFVRKNNAVPIEEPTLFTN